jgi:pyruvate ferredoxin oxidoreductase alpha subunit
MTEDAEIVFVGMGTLALPVRVAVRKMREQGIKVGFVRIKWFRPFATDEISALLSRFKCVGVIDRDYSFGAPSYGGVLFQEIRSALYNLEKRPLVQGFICGLGGREVRGQNVIEMADIMQKAVTTGKIEQDNHWIGVRA